MPSARYSPTMPIIASLVISLCFVATAFAQDVQRKSGGVFQASATKRVEPAYPPLALAAQVSGSVVVEITLDKEGNVTAARALSGHPLLKDSAVESAKAWKFAPTTLSGVPVKVVGTITFNFSLDHSKDIEWVKEQLAAEPNSAQLHQKLGELFNADGHPEKAIEELTEALRIGGDSSQILFALGEAYLSSRRYVEATEAYKRALSTNSLPDFAEMINMRLGESFLSQELNETALEIFKQVAGANPESPSAHYQLGLTYLKLGDKLSAMNEYTILKDLNAPLADALHRLLEKQN